MEKHLGVEWLEKNLWKIMYIWMTHGKFEQRDK